MVLFCPFYSLLHYPSIISTKHSHNECRRFMKSSLNYQRVHPSVGWLNSLLLVTGFTSNGTRTGHGHNWVAFGLFWSMAIENRLRSNIFIFLLSLFSTFFLLLIPLLLCCNCHNYNNDFTAHLLTLSLGVEFIQAATSWIDAPLLRVSLTSPLINLWHWMAGVES